MNSTRSTVQNLLVCIRITLRSVRQVRRVGEALETWCPCSGKRPLTEKGRFLFTLGSSRSELKQTKKKKKAAFPCRCVGLMRCTRSCLTFGLG
jgi:hypothetical protein